MNFTANPASPRSCSTCEWYQGVTTAPSHSQSIIASEAEEVKDAVLGPLKRVKNSKRKLRMGQFKLLWLNIEFLFTDILLSCSYSGSIFLSNFCLPESLAWSQNLIVFSYSGYTDLPRGMDTHKHWQAKNSSLLHTDTKLYMKTWWVWDWTSCSRKKNPRAGLFAELQISLTVLSLWWDVNISFRARPCSQSSTRRKWTQSIQLFTTGEKCAVCNKITQKRNILSKIFKNHLIDPSFNHLSIFSVHATLSHE